MKEFEKQIQKWTHFRVLREQNHVYSVIATALLQKPIKLKDIMLDLYGVKEGRPNAKDTKLLVVKKLLFLSALKNAPNLTQLRIFSIPINLADLEKIHEVIPKLKSLYLLGVVLRIDDNLFNVKPHDKSVSRIQIKKQCHSLETSCMDLESSFCLNSAKYDSVKFQWLDYIARKHTSLKKIAFKSNSADESPTRAVVYDPYMLPILPSCPELINDIQLFSWPLSVAVENMVNQRDFKAGQEHKTIFVSKNVIPDKMVEFLILLLAKYITSLCIKTPAGFPDYRRERPANAKKDPYYVDGDDPLDYYAKEKYELELYGVVEDEEEEEEDGYIPARMCDDRNDKTIKDKDGNMHPNPNYTIFGTLQRLTKLKNLEIDCLERCTRLEVLPKMMQSMSTLESITINGIFIK